MDKAFSVVSQHVSDFKANEAAYLSPSYQEGFVQQKPINKFFIDDVVISKQTIQADH